MSAAPFNVLVTGMGGQGCVTFGRVLSVAAARAGWRVAGSEKRGGAQRGGAAEVMLRLLPPDALPEGAYAAVVPPGNLDLLVGLEPLEAWRRVALTSSRTFVLLDTTPIEPALARGYGFETPDFATIQAGVAAGGATVVAVDLAATAKARFGREAMANLLALAWLAESGRLPIGVEHVRAAANEVLGSRGDTEDAWRAGSELRG